MTRQTTGGAFVTVQSARAAIGHDNQVRNNNLRIKLIKIIKIKEIIKIIMKIIIIKIGENCACTS